MPFFLAKAPSANLGCQDILLYSVFELSLLTAKSTLPLCLSPAHTWNSLYLKHSRFLWIGRWCKIVSCPFQKNAKLKAPRSNGNINKWAFRILSHLIVQVINNSKATKSCPVFGRLSLQLFLEKVGQGWVENRVQYTKYLGAIIFYLKRNNQCLITWPACWQGKIFYQNA